MQITKQIAGLLYGNSYLLQDSDGAIHKIVSIWDDCIMLDSDAIEESISIKFSDIGKDYKILARRNDLTKPIIVEGKVVVPMEYILPNLFDCKDVQRYEEDGIVTYGYSRNYIEDSEFYEYAWNDKTHQLGIYCDGYDPEDDRNYSVVDLANIQLFEWLQSHNFRGNLPEELVTYNDDVYNT